MTCLYRSATRPLPGALIRSPSKTTTTWIRKAKYRPAPSLTTILGLALLFAFVLAGVLATYVAPATPFQSIGPPFAPPSSAYWFGTDDLGRDIFSGVVYGARTSLLVGFSVAGASLVIGTLVGSIAGFGGTRIDDLLMRFSELLQVMPRFFLALVVVALFGTSLTNLILVLMLTSWASTARLARAGVLAIKGYDFVTAARSLGVAEWSILMRHILPNCIAPLLVHAALQVGTAILLEAGLSFIGLGDPNQFSWGYMINNAQAFMRRAWWMSIFPGSAVALAVLSVNLLSDGLNDDWNPRRKRHA